MKLVLFEDTEPQAETLIAALRSKINGRGTVHLFAEGENKEGTFEKRVFEGLQAEPYAGATLIVADRDLSKTRGFTGLSEDAVRRAADKLAIPECSYHRYAAESDAILVEPRQPSINVSITDGPDRCADQILSVEEGFGEILRKLKDELRRGGKKSPGRIMAGILGKAEYAEKISLYASGDQNRLVDVLRIGKTSGELQVSQIACLLGYWLWDSILCYPGVVLNPVAAASYLNIKSELFQADADVRALFATAQYSGPFASAREPLWWRGMLDDVVAGQNCADGREFAAVKLGREIPQSECCEDEAQAAGYYCMLSNKPVSLANSYPGLPWFPRGADLARVSKSRYEELGPWL